MKLIWSLVLVFAVAGSMTGCKSASADNPLDGTDVSEAAQQIGDAMASIDEAGGSGGSIASYQRAAEKSFARVFPNEVGDGLFSDLWMPKANAAACSVSGSSGFGSCSSNTITRNFNGCTVHDSLVFSGTVTLTWGGAASGCVITGNGGYIKRAPNFTVQGRRSATLTVTKTGTDGQTLTLPTFSSSPKVYSLTNDGINRKFTVSGSSTPLFDHTTTITSAITVTGDVRNGRVMTGGNLRIKNNISNVICNYVPSGVTWGSTSCNCPTAGSWSGTCDDGNGHTSSATLVINGCGTGTYTEGSNTSDVTFDRCGT